MKTFEQKALNLHQVNIKLFLFSLIVWVVVLFGGLLLDIGPDMDQVYKPVTMAMAISLLVFGILHIWFGIIKDFSFDSIFRTVISLFIPLALLNGFIEGRWSVTHLMVAAILYALGLLGMYQFQSRQKIKQEENQKKKQEENGDTSIRGNASIFQTGSDSFKLVYRNNINSETQAKKFEGRLIRFLEKKLDIIPRSMSGDNCDYWRINIPNYWVELIVIGTGFNTVSKLKSENDWLLRIREPQDKFSQWIAPLFVEQKGVVRSLGKGKFQYQFSSNDVANIKSFFKQKLPEFSLLEILKLSPV